MRDGIADRHSTLLVNLRKSWVRDDGTADRHSILFVDLLKRWVMGHGMIYGSWVMVLRLGNPLLPIHFPKCWVMESDRWWLDNTFRVAWTSRAFALLAEMTSQKSRAWY